MGSSRPNNTGLSGVIINFFTSTEIGSVLKYDKLNLRKICVENGGKVYILYKDNTLRIKDSQEKL